MLAVGLLAVLGAFVRQDIFEPSPRFPCFRQPAIVSAGKDRQTVLAFAENRNVSECAPAFWDVGSPEETGSLQLRRSLDGGASWGPLQSLAVGNIDFYAVTTARGGERVVLFLQDRTTSTPKVFVSEDAGASWESRGGLQVHVPHPFTSALKPTVGHGIVVEAGMCSPAPCKEAGRLVVPLVCTNSSVPGGGGDKAACPSCTACLVYSDDSGDTWHFGGVGPPGSREAEVAQIVSNTSESKFYMNARNVGPEPGHRWAARCSEAGKSCGDYTIDLSLTSPVTPHWSGIVDSVISVPGPGLLWSGIGDTSARANLTFRRSSDAGASWGPATTVWPGPASYSDLAPVGQAGGAVMIFENGDLSFADRVSVVVLPPP